jgi:hypothetical protein
MTRINTFIEIKNLCSESYFMSLQDSVRQMFLNLTSYRMALFIYSAAILFIK